MAERKLSIFKSVAVSAVVAWDLQYRDEYKGKPAQMYEFARQYVGSHTIDEIIAGADGVGGIGQDSLTSIVSGVRTLGAKIGIPELAAWSNDDIARMIKEEDPALETAIRKAGEQYKGDLAKDVVDTLESIHDSWVENPANSNKYFARDRKYQYLPLEFMGWSEAHSDLLFLEPVIQASGIETDLERIRNEFEKREAQLVHDLIKDGVIRAFTTYAPIQGRQDIIQDVLKNPEIQDRITEQSQVRAGAIGRAYLREHAFEYAPEKLAELEAKLHKTYARENAEKALSILKTHDMREMSLMVLNGLKPEEIGELSLEERIQVGTYALRHIMDPANAEPGFRNQQELNDFKEALHRLGVDDTVFIQNPELLEEQSDRTLEACSLMVASQCGTCFDANEFYKGITEKGWDAWLTEQKVSEKERKQDQNGTDDQSGTDSHSQT